MKIKFSILALCLLTGCFNQESKPPVPPKATEKPEAIEPFGLKTLLQKPIEDLPEGIPQFGSRIHSKYPPGNFVALESLEGNWYGAVFGISPSTPQKDTRVYLQFRSDQSFSYACVEIDEEMSFAFAQLITGKYLIEDGNLQLQTELHEEYTRTNVSEGSNLLSFTLMCGSSDWKQSGSTLTIPLRQLNLKTIVLFDRDFSNARVFLVRK